MPPQKNSVIVVDGDDAALQVSKKIFTELGYEVFGFNDPNRALRSMEDKKLNWKPTLVMTDVILPQMSGFELMRRFEARFNKNEIILVMTSKYNSPEDTLEAGQAGAFGLIKKPLDPSKIKQLIEQFNLRKIKAAIGNEVFQIGYE